MSKTVRRFKDPPPVYEMVIGKGHSYLRRPLWWWRSTCYFDYTTNEYVIEEASHG